MGVGIGRGEGIVVEEEAPPEDIAPLIIQGIAVPVWSVPRTAAPVYVQGDFKMGISRDCHHLEDAKVGRREADDGGLGALRYMLG